MAIEYATLLIVGALFLLMLIGIPLGIVTLTVSVVTALLYFGPNGLGLVGRQIVGVLGSYSFVAVPLFVLMASLMERAGIAEDLFDSMSVLAGKMRGGVAVQTTVVAVIMAAMAGVIGGEVMMLGLIALPQMLRLGYDSKLSIGTICASGSLATLVPPSIVMIIYGITANVSIGDLFLGGVLPGLLLAALYIAYILIRVNLNPGLAPLPETGPGTDEKGVRLKAVRGLLVPVLIVTVVLGSIYSGIAAITEAAAIGVAGALLAAVFRGRLNLTMLREALQQTFTTVGAIIWLIMGAVSLVGIYNLIGGASFMQNLISGLDLPPIGIVLVMMGILMVLGTFLEWIAILLITVPIFAPVVAQLPFEWVGSADEVKVWFGVLVAINIQIYFLSPPFGPACFFLKSVAPKHIQLQEIFVSVLPFVGLQILGLILCLAFPEIILALPRLLGN
ncbi:MAG: TRAP transporter large permease subunit [Nitratireductor sp.]|nr:TRAP transporter large permease subunit [Nitratireductor sp.]